MAAYESGTRMGIDNLALVFAPNVLRADDSDGFDAMAALADATPAAQALAAMVRNRHDIFPEAKQSPLQAQAEAIEALRQWGGAAAATPAPTPPASWYYVGAGGEQAGPVSAHALLSMAARGELERSAWVFEAGTAVWVSFDEAQPRLGAGATVTS